MKKLLFLMVLASSLNAWSIDNPEKFNKLCATTYRTAAKDMLKLIKQFHKNEIDAKELAALSTSVKTQVMVARAPCVYLEKPEARSCSDRYKEIYTEVNSRVSAGALFLGTQQQVQSGRAYALLTEANIFFVDAGCHNFL